MKNLFLGLLLLVSTASAAEPLKLGVVGPRTGSAAATGKSFEEGIALALERVNGKGGVLGRPLEILFEDTGGVPEKAASAFEKLATADKVAAVLGESHSSCALAELELAERYKVPLIIAEAWHDDITKKGYRHVFRAGPANSGVVHGTISKFVKDAGFRKVAVVSENSDWGKGIAALTVADLTAMKVPFSAMQVDKETKDFYPELTKLKAEKPDLVIAYVYGFGLHNLVAQAAETGLTPGTLILDGAGPPSLWPEFWKNVGKAGEKELFLSSMHESVHLTPESKKFWEAYVKKFGKAPTDYKARSIYNTILIAVDAVARAKSTDSEKLVAALEKTDLEVTTGRVRFGLKSGGYEYHQWMPPMLMIQWQDEKQVVVYPAKAKTGALKR